MDGRQTELTGATDGNRLLHRLDPRLKLLLLLLLVITIFSARSFVVLGIVAGLALLLLLTHPGLLRGFARRLYYLRWLLLFSLLLHLCLTPGWTLFGLRLLSYDGLLRGLQVDVQLVLAFFFASCLALFTSPQAVAWGGVRLLAPLRYLGVPVDEPGGLFPLVLHFLPQVFRQGVPLASQARRQKRLAPSERLQQLACTVGDLVLELVEQADRLAHDLWRGKSPLSEDETVYRWRSADSLGLLGGLLFAGLCWSL